MEQGSTGHTCLVLPTQDTLFSCKSMIKFLPEDRREQKDKELVVKRKSERIQIE